MALIPVAIAVMVVYGIVNYAVNLRFHINEAKRSGLPYVVARAFHLHSPLRQMFI